MFRDDTSTSLPTGLALLCCLGEVQDLLSLVLQLAQGRDMSTALMIRVSSPSSLRHRGVVWGHLWMLSLTNCSRDPGELPDNATLGDPAPHLVCHTVMWTGESSLHCHQWQMGKSAPPANKNGRTVPAPH